MRMDKVNWPRCLLWHGWLPMLSGVNGVSPWAAGASESAFWLSLRLAGILLVFLLRGVPLLILMLLTVPLCFLIILMSGLMVALFLIGLLVCPLLLLVSLLISLLPVGIIGVGVMLIRFARLVVFSVAGNFFLFLGLSSLFNVLSYGVLFLLYSPLVLSILVLIIGCCSSCWWVA